MFGSDSRPILSRRGESPKDKTGPADTRRHFASRDLGTEMLSVRNRAPAQEDTSHPQIPQLSASGSCSPLAVALLRCPSTVLFFLVYSFPANGLTLFIRRSPQGLPRSSRGAPLAAAPRSRIPPRPLARAGYRDGRSEFRRSLLES